MKVAELQDALKYFDSDATVMLDIDGESLQIGNIYERQGEHKEVVLMGKESPTVH